MWYIDWPLDKLKWYKGKLQAEFDELWEKHEKPLLMRHIGCELIYIINLIKERESNESMKSGNS